MNISIFILSLVTLQAVCWWAGKRTVKGVKTQNDYFLGGRSVAFFPLMATFLATQVGGGIVLGSAQEAQKVGWWVIFYPLGQVLGLILLGCGIGKRLSHFKVSTIAQIFEVAYRSPFLKRTASLLSIVSLFMILIGQVIASKKFLLALGVDEPWLFVLFWGVLIAYTSMGGMKAVIATDLIQAFFLIAIFLLAFGVAYFSGATPSVLDTAAFEAPTEKFSGWLLLPFLFTFIEQDMGQRCFAASSTSILAKASIGAGLVAFSVCLIPVYFGILGQQYGVKGEGSVLMAAVSMATNPTVAALVGCAVIAAILSTANSLINAIGSNLSEDFLNNRRSMNLTKAISSLIGIGAIFASCQFSNIVDVLMLSYELSISCLFVPLMAALFGKNKRFSLARISHTILCEGVQDGASDLLSSGRKHCQNDKKSPEENKDDATDCADSPRECEKYGLEAILAIVCGALGFFLVRLVTIPFPKEMVALGLSLLGFFAGSSPYLSHSRVIRWTNRFRKPRGGRYSPNIDDGRFIERCRTSCPDWRRECEKCGSGLQE